MNKLKRSMDYALDIQGLKKNFGLKPVLRGVDLELQAGKRMALLGVNGTGKTTLLRILAGLTKADKGYVSVNGFDMAQHAQQIRGIVGFVAHQPYLYDELTALENLLFFARLYNVPDAKARALYLLQRVGLERRVQERVGTLSRGQVQRVAFARALLHSPLLLLLDEPDTGMDQEGNELLAAILQEHVHQGGSTLFTTHQLEHAFALSDRVALLSNGRIAWQKETRNLELDSLRKEYQEVMK